MKVEITNVVVQTQLNVKIDLRKLVRKIRDARFDPKKFSAIIWYRKIVGGSCLLFNNGKLICHGAKDMCQAKKVARRYARLVQNNGYAVKLSPITLVTASALADVDQPVSLPKIPLMYARGSYEPELFNAGTFRIQNLHFSVFASGKIVITGITRLSLINTVIRPTLLELVLM